MPFYMNTDKYEFLESAFMRLIPELRKTYSLDIEQIRGKRFLDDIRIWHYCRGELGREDRPISFDEAILGTLPEDEMQERIKAGLSDAASADHWYMYEKDYG